MTTEIETLTGRERIPMRHLIEQTFRILSAPMDPIFQPMDLIGAAMKRRRKKRVAIKDRSKIKAARKQRNRT